MVFTDPEVSCCYLKVFGAHTVPHQQMERSYSLQISLTLDPNRTVTARGAQGSVSVHSGSINQTCMFIDHADSFTLKYM